MVERLSEAGENRAPAPASDPVASAGESLGGTRAPGAPGQPPSVGPVRIAGHAGSEWARPADPTDPLATLEDAELVARFQARAAGDNRAFRELFRRYQAMVWHVSYGFVRNPDDAEDLTQEVFLKAYRALDRFEHRSSFKTWLYRVAINTCQNELRRRDRRPKPGDTPLEDMAEQLPGGDLPERGMMSATPSEPLGRALARLSPEVVTILYMKDVHELSYEEIAELLEIGVSAAKMRVHRARLALQGSYLQALEPTAAELMA
ncbi:MAG: sigma-70 family RNA polymerase sigma factor [Caldilineae bacterium]|nr:sigma-70 family RNA polymerase sigma factor [Caldilineae bacterium]